MNLNRALRSEAPPVPDAAAPPGPGAGLYDNRDSPPSPPPRRNRRRPGQIGGSGLRQSLYYIIFAWFFGAFWMFSTTGATATLLAQYLGANDLIFGYLAAAGYLGAIFQLAGSLYTRRTGKVKNIFLWSLTAQRVLYLPLALLPWLFPAADRAGALTMVILLFVASAAGNIGSPAWTQWMAQLVPARVRGKYFSRRNRVGIMVSAVTAILVGVLLDAAHRGGLDRLLGPVSRWAGMPPLIFTISALFLLATLSGVTDIQSYHRVAEPPLAPHPQSEGVWRHLLSPLRDRPFLLYVLYSMLFTFAIAFAGTFSWVMMLSLVRHRGGEHSWFAANPNLAVCLMLMLTTNIGQILGYPFWGRLIDRLGCKPVIMISSTLHSLTLLVWIFISVHTFNMGFAGAFFGGAAWSAIEIANFNLVLAFTRRGGPAYQAVLAILANVAGLLAGLGAGVFAMWMRQHHPILHVLGWNLTRYNVLFALTLGIKCVADYAILPFIHDPDAKPVRYAIRYIMGNMFDMLNSQVLGPVRNVVGNEGFRPWRRWK